jgi:hypothetical protein
MRISVFILTLLFCTGCKMSEQDKNAKLNLEEYVINELQVKEVEMIRGITDLDEDEYTPIAYYMIEPSVSVPITIIDSITIQSFPTFE